MRKLVRNIFRMENNILSKIISSRKSLINSLKEWRPERSSESAIQLIFYKCDTKGLKGKTIKELISSLSHREKDE
jgi:hypothetical protein